MGYPRPQMKRKEWQSLDGEWVVNGSAGRVPECRTEEILIYERSFVLDRKKPVVILHFGAVDNKARVFLNGEFVGEHAGGYLPFSFDVSDKIGHENLLRVEVSDMLDPTYPYGKQKKESGGMWYTPVSGIWQSVWLEQLPESYISDVKIKTDLKGADITLNIKDPNGERVETERIEIQDPELWTPDAPKLYTYVLKRGEDEVEVYFGLRTIEIREIGGRQRLLLNGEPVFLHGVLDQGYFYPGLFIPEDSSEYERDIARMKSLGFNMLRKHIKIEPEEYYYAADKCGMLIIQDMVNSGNYNFFRDTFLGTVGVKFRDTKKKHDERTSFFTNHSINTVRHLYNHPSVIAYTIFNEGWGQFDSDRHYEVLKGIDPSRVYDSTSGWFAQKKSDFDSVHIYFRNKKLNPGIRPMLLSECGGFSLNLDKKRKTYGYGKCQSRKELTDRISDMYEKMVIPAIERGLCGAVYTQLSDVEDEINGLYSYDRKTLKVIPERMLEIAEKIKDKLR
ncbi:MAG: glycoside hydrolase family 2 [Clostridia bacterium]|nr:glycoside hydrolase family 2 [Clostridia bacterium]